MFETHRDAGCGGRRTIPVRLYATLGALCLLIGFAGSAQAQCVGDCNDNGDVGINELITGVGISLGNLPLANCPTFDANDSGTVQINELITAVNNALDGCPTGGTPTATTTSSTAPPVTFTPTPTATSIVTPGECATNTPAVAAGCGNGQIDFGAGETCDDGNTDEGDNCPGNCRIAACKPSGTTFAVRLDFDTEQPDVFIQGLQLFVRYPESIISLPGENDDAAVLESVSSANFSVGPFDLNYGTNLLVTDETFLGFESGEAATMTFDLCEGATLPTACDLTCVVRAAVDADFNDVPTDEVTCTVVVP